ncbi:MAG: flagellar basal body-associated FliL family protein [candidate division Zixibacteria bacterium]|nr:flagellar basal body-associated FliL family protein [candidate division Zixibacteria bacterium]
MPEVEQAKAPAETIEVEGDTQKTSTQKGGGLKTYFIIMMALQVVLAAGGYFIVIKYLKPDPAFHQIIAEEKKAEEKPKVEEIPHQIYNIEDIVVNPAGTGGSRYLSVSIGVEMDAPKATESEGGHGHGEGEARLKSPLDEKKPQLRDALISLLSAKTIDQLTSVEQKDHIRAEIMDTFSKILAPAKVHNIFFIDYVLQ